MNAILPDVSFTETAPLLQPLRWVGMQAIDASININEAGYDRVHHAKADVQVDLPRPQVKGIHMSRLYRILDDRLSSGVSLGTKLLRQALEEMVDSHQDCGSTNARLRLTFDLLVRRSALVTEGLSGWKSYPVQIDAVLEGEQFSGRKQVMVQYSSTCPCSAALSRQLIEQEFREAVAAGTVLDMKDVSGWLQKYATLATPHSQRSEACISVDLVDNDAKNLGLLRLVDGIEGALATPVQTAVKRADEQAFAALNGQNLMFVEDAARRLENALKDWGNPDIHVRHLESLHPHDAAAWAGGLAG